MAEKERGPNKVLRDRVAELDKRIVAAHVRLDALEAKRKAMVDAKRARAQAILDEVGAL
jgi:predicted short-subunit dehydrogenase-like oxidoreductase (DUF2520 family)